jgi:hypothetical protein
MKVTCCVTSIRSWIIAMVLLTGVAPGRALAQDHAHATTVQHESREQRNKRNALVKVVQDATARFWDVSAAEDEDYHLMFGCVTGSDWGAMGLHYVNMELVKDGELDPTRPEIVLYEPQPNGRPRLTGADFLIFAEDWDKKHPEGPPQLMGQLFHHFGAPNRFGLPAFYTLHVWAWKNNPAGTFTNWHTHVTCDAFPE